MGKSASQPDPDGLVESAFRDVIVVRVNTIHDNEFIGIHINGDPNVVSGALIENNVIFDNGGRGVQAFQSDHIIVRANTIYGNNWDPTSGATRCWTRYARTDSARRSDRRWL